MKKQFMPWGCTENNKSAKGCGGISLQFFICFQAPGGKLYAKIKENGHFFTKFAPHDKIHMCFNGGAE